MDNKRKAAEFFVELSILLRRYNADIAARTTCHGFSGNLPELEICVGDFLHDEDEFIDHESALLIAKKLS